MSKLTRRGFLSAALAAPAGIALATEGYENTAVPLANSAERRFNISSFRTQRWQDYFSNTNGGAILVDMESFALHYWNSDQSIYKLYPVAIPLKGEFEKRGKTTVVRKVAGPEWRPTPSMLERDPTLPSYVGPGPENPLGTHALYLGWQYYRIHGNNDQRKIGRRASSGCIGLYNQQIEDLFALVDVGCQVVMI